MKKQLLLLLTLLLAFVLAACNNDEAEEEANEDANITEEAPQEVEITEEEKADTDAAVVNVNGTEILGDKYNDVYKQLKTMYGQEITDLDALKDETTEVLINQELIIQDAEERGIQATEEDVQKEIDNMVETNGEDALTSILEQSELSEDEFRKQLNDTLTFVKYIESEFTVEVEDEEVEEQYEQLKEQNEEIGELAEYEDMIRQNIVDQKQAQMLEERIAELKEDAEIEKFI